jgi:hypothetical protein
MSIQWKQIESRGTTVDALFKDGVLMGYVAVDLSRPEPGWLLYRGDHQLFFRVWSRGEAMTVLEEIVPTLEFQQCPRVEVGA